MSYNVNYGLAGDPEGIAAIRDGGADLVVLQETTAAWERALRPALADLYPHMAFRHCCGAGGLAFLSRFPLAEQRYLPPTEEGWFPAWHVIVDTPLGPVQVLAVHLHPPLSEGGSVVSGYFTTPSVRREEIESFAAGLDDSLPTLVVGDFNEPAGGGAVQFLARSGLRSALPEFHAGANTWQWTTSVGTVHSQLDHIVYDPRLRPLDARVLPVGNSDHRPVVAVFERVP
jgi:endonuclease/exonuclease/phosphatase (EEP) superfamily protein YafD